MPILNHATNISRLSIPSQRFKRTAQGHRGKACHIRRWTDDASGSTARPTCPTPPDAEPHHQWEDIWAELILTSS